MPSLMRFADHGVEYVGDKRVVRLGRLNVLHGHEYHPHVQNPVSPARGIFMRAHAVVLCGHWHQTTQHHQPSVTGKPLGAWSAGCCCQLNPAWKPINPWNHGFARVDINEKGDFVVRNLRVFDGRVV
jgi:hypothetical protein